MWQDVPVVDGQRIGQLLGNRLYATSSCYAVGVGVGLLVLEERNQKLDKQGKKRPRDTLTERVAAARAALALMPDFDKLVMEAGLE